MFKVRDGSGSQRPVLVNVPDVRIEVTVAASPPRRRGEVIALVENAAPPNTIKPALTMLPVLRIVTLAPGSLRNPVQCSVGRRVGE